MRSTALMLLLSGMLVCAVLVVWSAVTNYRAKECLEGGHTFEWHAASITENGCEVVKKTGEVVVMPISGPSFEAGVAGGVGFVALGSATATLLVRRGRRTAPSPEAAG